MTMASNIIVSVDTVCVYMTVNKTEAKTKVDGSFGINRDTNNSVEVLSLLVLKKFPLIASHSLGCKCNNERVNVKAIFISMLVEVKVERVVLKEKYAYCLISVTSEFLSRNSS